MKKLLVIAAASLLAASAFAQGTLTYSTGGGTGSTLKYGSDPMFGALAGATYNGTYGPIRMGLWIGPAGATEAQLTLDAGSIKTVGTAGPSQGNISASAYNVPGTTAAATITLQIRAWSGASYGAGAVAAKSGVTQITLGGGALSPTVAWAIGGVAPTSTWNGVPTTGTGPLAGIALHAVPEPASASIIGLGLASLLIFRRRS
jgi:hypothetical protein